LAIGVAAVIGVVATWLGILLAYDTAAWSAQGPGWPVSFCIVAVIFTFYLVVSLSTHRRGAAFSTRSAVGADLGH
jgi:zinc/manganese transport system permease protein